MILQNNQKLRLKFLILIMAIIIPLSKCQNLTCHYTCLTCSASNYYQCSTCPNNRGNQNNLGIPYAGMCYCLKATDQDQNGNCLSSDQYNYNNKALITSFIGLSLFLAILMCWLRGSRYYLIKIIEDIQEISIIVYINLYFPQQFDIFLTYLYRFNFSSYTFESMADGSLFYNDPLEGLKANSGGTIFGKYKLLYKSANFFANQFTWLIVVFAILVLMICLKIAKNKILNSATSKVSGEKNSFNESFANISNNSQILNQNPSEISESSPQKQRTHIVKYSQKHPQRNYKQLNIKNLVITVHNYFWYNFLITLFYLSLIEINVNIFTQFSNMTFGSPFESFGTFIAALFLILEIVVLVLLIYKTRIELVKPEWMRDHSYSATYYLLRTNYKTLTKYFFFIQCLKKLLFGLFIVVYYQEPINAILSISIVQLIYISIAMYCEPHQKRHLRIHFYLTEVMKLFFFVSLINFVSKYKEFAKLIEITKILFLMLALVFGLHFITIVLSLIIQRNIYWYETKKMFKRIKKWLCNGQNNHEEQDKIIIGYFHYILNGTSQHDETDSKKQNKYSTNNDSNVMMDKQILSQKQKPGQNLIFNDEPKQQENKYFYVYQEH